MKTFPVTFKYLICVLFAIVSLILGIGIGSVFIAPDEIFLVVAERVFGLSLPEGINEITASIIMNVRLPRAICAFVVGAGLSVGGAVMQSVLANPLASGYTLGVSSGASLGVTIAVFFGASVSFAGMFSLPLMGFIFGLGTVLVAVSAASKLDRNAGNATIILIGMVMSLFVNAVVTLIMGINREAAKSVIYWQMGSFSGKDFEAVAVIFPITVLIILFLLRFTHALDIMTFGDEHAMSVGVNIKRTKILLLTLSAALTGTAVAFVGAIGFIDLIVPHAVRKIFGAKHSIVLPMSAVLGGGFMVVADLAARTVLAPSELPVGAVTAIIGAPIFGYIFLKKSR
jgi:iron complex transport system permease protein